MFELRLYFYFMLTVAGTSSAKNSTANTTNKYFNNFEFVPRVVNGWPGKLGDVPYQIAFKAPISRYYRVFATFCGGTIISPFTVLTAAHCFAENPSVCQRIFKNTGSRRSLSQKYAVAGQLLNRDYYAPDSADRGQWRALKYVKYPRTYNFPKDDIALVYTIHRFIFNNRVNYIPYAVDHKDYVGNCLVSGFGRMAREESSDILYLAHLTLMPARQCSYLFRKNMWKFICTSSQLTDVGKGDSGGPLVCARTGDANEDPTRGVLVGVVSGNRPGVCSFFTRVSAFRKYIAQGYSHIARPFKILYVIIAIKTIFVLF